MAENHCHLLALRLVLNKHALIETALTPSSPIPKSGTGQRVFLTVAPDGGRLSSAAEQPVGPGLFPLLQDPTSRAVAH